MVGREPRRALSPRAAHAGRAGPRARPASRPETGAEPSSLALRRGEILGIAGLIGAGRTTLVRSIFGLGRSSRGKSGSTSSPAATLLPRTRIDQGVGFASEDRKTEGLALSRSIEDNMTYSALKRHARWGWLRLQEPARRSRPLDRAAANRARRGPRRSRRNLSGGNQQKVALARLLHQRADVLLLDEPTRGIDVGSKAEIYRLIGEQAAAGKAILVVSSYLPELFGICDRIAVMARGALSEARPVSEWTEHEVMDVATRTDASAVEHRSKCDRFVGIGRRAIAVAGKPGMENDEEAASIKLRGSLGWAWTVFGPFVGLVLIILLFSVLTRQSGTFLTVDNWRTIAVQTVIVGIAALGMTIDHDRRRDRPFGRLDGGARDRVHRRCSCKKSTPCLPASLREMKLVLPLALLLGIAIGGLCGAINGGLDRRTAGRPVHRHAGNLHGLPRVCHLAGVEHARSISQATSSPGGSIRS